VTGSGERSAADPGVVVQRIATDLRAAGVRPGGVLLVHSSLSSMGHVVGGPETVILGLLEVLGPEGTLLMPALSYEHVTTKNPIFDARRTPSNVGAIPESFRKRAGTRRSMHPTHSVCGVGPRTAELLGDHALDRTPCGPNSPFHKLRDAGGQILMLGCGLRPNTSMHAIEELVEPPYLFGREKTYVLIYPDGRQEERVYMAHGFRGWTQRYDRVARVLAYPALWEARVLAATAQLIDVPALWQAALAALARDELFFVDREVPGPA
jgi:aminoglycoside 3-N-acetyltransferase